MGWSCLWTHFTDVETEAQLSKAMSLRQPASQLQPPDNSPLSPQVIGNVCIILTGFWTLSSEPVLSTGFLSLSSSLRATGSNLRITPGASSLGRLCLPLSSGQSSRDKEPPSTSAQGRGQRPLCPAERSEQSPGKAAAGFRVITAA